MINSETLQIGLVLTGGGAKGAYQAGALTYLAELGLKPQIIAGTSIGALNGAVLSSYQPFDRAVQRLNELWDHLGTAGILRPHSTKAEQIFSYATQSFVPTFREWILDFLIKENFLKDRSSIYDPAPIEQLLRQTVNAADLRRGIELWVTVFPSLKIPGLAYDCLLDLVRARTGIDAHWLCVQDIEDDETLYNLLLASVAIPLAFPSRNINGKFYVDGGLADNVPLRALAARGCTHAIVIHLQNGSVWNRHTFPNQTIIEIRPEKTINNSQIPLIGSLASLLDFNAERIAALKQWGYADAKRCIEPILETFRVVNAQRYRHQSLVDPTQRLLNDDPL